MKHPANAFVHMVWIHQIVWQTRRIVKLKMCQKCTSSALPFSLRCFLCASSTLRNKPGSISFAIFLAFFHSLPAIKHSIAFLVSIGQGLKSRIQGCDSG